MQTDIGVDTGDILLKKELEINETETYGELSTRLSKQGAELIVECLDKIENGTITKTMQDESQATKTGLISKEDAKIDFSKTAFEIVNLIRGLNPSPVAYTYLDGKKLKIFKAKSVDIQGKCGEVLVADSKVGLIVGAGDNAVLIEELQLEGGKKMTSNAFLLGRKIQVGKTL
jgi:methionyl-tRNA formyltransferase